MAVDVEVLLNVPPLIAHVPDTTPAPAPEVNSY
jgi:hypothetical protein